MKTWLECGTVCLFTPSLRWYQIILFGNRSNANVLNDLPRCAIECGGRLGIEKHMHTCYNSSTKIFFVSVFIEPMLIAHYIKIMNNYMHKRVTVYRWSAVNIFMRMRRNLTIKNAKKLQARNIFFKPLLHDGRTQQVISFIIYNI